MVAILAAFGRGGAVLALIFLVVALLKQLIVLVGFLLALIKIAIVVAFVVMIVMIALAIFRDRSVLDAYTVHPDHVKVVEFSRGICDTMAKVDFED